MNINKELFEQRYKEMKAADLDEDFLDKDIEDLKLFINKKPKNVVFSLKIEDDDIYIGTN